jgi:hypothetical protein
MRKMLLMMALLTAVSAAPASAQVAFTADKWKVLSKPVRIQYNIPAGCDPSATAAAATWNGASKFQITGVAQNYTSLSATDSTATDPNFIDIRGSGNLAS